MTLTPAQRSALVDALENDGVIPAISLHSGLPLVSCGACKEVMNRDKDGNLPEYWSARLELTPAGRLLAEEIRRSERRAEVLRAVEWVVDEYDNEYGGKVSSCPCCDNWERDGHATDCDLAARLNS